MNCPKCNSAVTPGLLFCSECGFKIEKISDKASLKTDDSLEKTMTIPVIKPNNHRPSDFADSAVAERRNSESKNFVKDNFFAERGQSFGEKPNSNRTPGQKKKTTAKKSKNKLSRTQKNILLFLFVFITVVFLGLAGIGTAIKVAHNKPLKNIDLIAEKKEKVVTESKKEYEENEAPSKKDYGSSRHIAPYEPLIDLEYEFVRGISVDAVISPAMGDAVKSHENQEYSFICSVPGNFTLESEGDVEVRYVSEDKTAYVDIGALKNTGNWSMFSVRDAVIDALGGTVDYQSSGEGWFSVNVIKNGTYYYRKSFVTGETIRYFEIVYPEEYTQVFNNCVSDIDAGFRQGK